jgi:hypothetical protein
MLSYLLLVLLLTSLLLLVIWGYKMAVNLSPVGGVAGQFFDNNGNPLVGGKLFTYAAGTTTPQTTFTSSSGSTPNSNPIILNAGGRVPSEIWLTDGLAYKFVLYTSTDQLVGSWDNISGINSNFVNFTSSQEIQTATAGQTVFTLTTMQYQPGTNSLTVYVDGVNQYGPGGLFAYTETNSTTVTFTNGLHVGAEVKFTSVQQSTSSATSADQISYLPAGTGAVATNVQDKLRQTVSVKDFGAVGDGVTDDTAAIQAALDTISNTPLTTAFKQGGRTLYFPEGTYIISSPLVVKSVNTILQGEGSAATIIKATAGTFNTDTGPDTLGRWMVIWDANYVTSPEDLYNCHIFDMAFDFSNRTDVKGIWIGGGRNSSSIERVQFIRFYSYLIELGKSSRTVDSITQGFLVSNCYAIWEGNVGQHTVDRDGELFIISSGNENVFFNVDIASGAGETAIGTGFVVGNGSYQCGGNRFIGCGGTNFKAAHITVASVSGFLVGETILTGDGYRATISSISGSVLKVITTSAGNSAYVPRASDTITGLTSSTASTISSAVFGKVWRLSNSWNTVVDAPKVVENSVCGVFMDNATALNCLANVVRGGRLYSFTASCMVAFGRCSFNKFESDLYTDRTAILVGATQATASYFNVGPTNAAQVKFVSTDASNCAIEHISSGGINIRNHANTARFTGKNNTGGVKVDAFRTDLFDANQVRLLDRNGEARVITENSATPYVAILDSSGVLRVVVTHDGRVTMPNLPTSNPGTTNQIWNDGGTLKIV